MIISPKEGINELKRGNIIAIPTETVYGLAAVATDQSAIEKVYKIKNRPKDNPLIIHFYSIEQIQKYANIEDRTLEVLNKLSPGPLSVLVESKNNNCLSKLAIGDSGYFLARIPDNLVALEILKGVNLPLAAPSANLSGRMSGTNAQMVNETLGNKISGVVDGGDSTYGLESTIVDATKGIKILRSGYYGVEDFENVLGSSKNSTDYKGVTPGSKYKHYSPNKQVILIDSVKELENYSDYSLIAFDNFLDFSRSTNIHSLGKNNYDYAKNLYHKLYQADKDKTILIILQKYKKEKNPITRALEDRVSRIID